MIKKTKILSLGLAFALLASQTVQAEVLISPLDVSQAAEGQGAVIVGGQSGQNTETGSRNEQTKPDAGGQGVVIVDGQTGKELTGSQAGQNSQEMAVGGQTGPVAGGQTGTAGAQNGQDSSAGPDASQNQGISFANRKSYSTKEPVSGEGGTAASEAIAEPVVEAQSAILYDATHDRVLFEKNAGEKLYPASITKLMTALLVLEKTSMTDQVTFSKTATTNLESGAVTLKLAEGDVVSVKDCLYGLLIKSANEVANGLAEHVGGSLSGFAELMNAKAAALGCTGTHFVNPNGLNDPEHYTTSRDMAKIAKAAFENPTICEIASTLSYSFPATKNAGERTITPGHKMLYPTDSRYYEGIIGGKTGYTSLAGNTLVTCVERDGVRLIAVVLKARQSHYTDTASMLDYGFAVAKAGGQASYHRWVQDGQDWRFALADGTRLSNCLVSIDGVEYGFAPDGKMMSGWQRTGDDWYYFGTDGAMTKNDWKADGDQWFYLGSDGRMVRDALIDNTYYVNADGIWVPQQGGV